MIKTLHIAVRRYRAIFFVMGNIAVLAVCLWTVAPVYDLVANRDSEIAAKRETLVRLQTIAAREVEVQAAARQPDAQLDQGEFLAGSNEGVIGADLQTRLKAITERSGARIRTIQGQPPKPGDPIRYIGARLTIFGSLQRVHNAIYAIETEKPYLFVTDAVVKLASPVVRNGAPEEPVIEARLDVFGAALMGRQEP
jgi:general secretion pathway protein M